MNRFTETFNNNDLGPKSDPNITWCKKSLLHQNLILENTVLDVWTGGQTDKWKHRAEFTEPSGKPGVKKRLEPFNLSEALKIRAMSDL